jgi:hypothetical protein
MAVKHDSNTRCLLHRFWTSARTQAAAPANYRQRWRPLYKYSAAACNHCKQPLQTINDNLKPATRSNPEDIAQKLQRKFWRKQQNRTTNQFLLPKRGWTLQVSETKRHNDVSSMITMQLTQGLLTPNHREQKFLTHPLNDRHEQRRNRHQFDKSILHNRHQPDITIQRNTAKTAILSSIQDNSDSHNNPNLIALNLIRLLSTGGDDSMTNNWK